MTELIDEQDDFEETPLYRLALDPEANLLSALLFARVDGRVKAVLNTLTAEDFYNCTYAIIFETMQQLAADGRPIDPTSLAAETDKQGDKLEWKGVHPRRLLADLMGVRAIPENVSYYADQVLSAWYRRQFQTMAYRLQQIGEREAEDELFNRMVEEGKAQRRAWKRKSNFLKETNDE